MHVVNENVKFDFHYSPEKAEKKTTTAILDIDGVVYEHTIALYFKDKFDKRKARKIALSKVLEESPCNKKERREVWEVFKQKIKL